MINFYPLTSAEQTTFDTLTQSRVNNEPIMIMTQPNDTLIGVDVDDLQTPAYIDYFNAITFDATKIVVLDLDAIQALAESKSQKAQEISIWYATTVAAGFDTRLGFFMSFDESVRLAYTSYVVLLDKCVDRRSKLSTDTITILDKDQVSRQFTISALIDKLADYGEAYESIFISHTRYTLSLDTAQTVADVDAIIVP